MAVRREATHCCRRCELRRAKLRLFDRVRTACQAPVAERPDPAAHYRQLRGRDRRAFGRVEYSLPGPRRLRHASNNSADGAEPDVSPRQARRRGQEILILLIVEQCFHLSEEGAAGRVIDITRRLVGADDDKRAQVLRRRELQVADERPASPQTTGSETKRGWVRTLPHSRARESHPNQERHPHSCRRAPRVPACVPAARREICDRPH